MPTVDLSYIKKLFTQGYDSEGDQEAFRELLLMILARATDADSYTHPAEVATVQRVVKEHLGEDISEEDVHRVAVSELYQTAPLEKYIAGLAPKLSLEQRKHIIRALIEVLQSDGQVATSESVYFNSVALSLRMTYAEVAGLV
jgi:uncharacterized tellurite resistance protein B-like protein